MYWKPRGIWTAQRILCSAPSCHYQWHAELIMLCDHLMWHWPLTWPVACLPPSPPSLFIRQIWQTPGSELCGPSLLCNRSRLHCDTCQRGRKWRSDSLNYLCGNPLSLHSSSCLRSIYYSICLCTEVHAVGTRHTKERAMDLETRRQFDNVILISRNWKMTLGGRLGWGNCCVNGVRNANLI